MSHPSAVGNINYQKASISSLLIVSEYDFTSLMHSPGNMGLLETYDSSVQNVIGQRSYLPDCDIAKINRYYECSGYDHPACPVGGEEEPTTEYYYYCRAEDERELVSND